MIRTPKVASAFALTACAQLAIGQCSVTQWGEVGGGANSGQGYTSTIAAMGMGSKMQALSMPSFSQGTLIASFDIGKEIKRVRAIGGSTAWASDGAALWAFNALNAASNPLRFQSTLTVPGGIRDFLPVGLTIYAWNASTVTVIDYTNAASPTIVSTIALPNAPFEATFLNNRLYFLSSGRTVQIIDVTDPANPAFIRALSLGGNLFTTNAAPYAFSGGGSLVHFAFYSTSITVGSNNLRIVDINADQLAGTSGSVPVTGSIVQISGNWMLQPNNLVKINWANPLAPTFTTVYTDMFSRFRSFGTAASAGTTRAYIAGSEGGVSVTNADTGGLLSSYFLQPGNAADAAFFGSTGNLYVADGLAGLKTELLTDNGVLNRQFVHNNGALNLRGLTNVACGGDFCLAATGTSATYFTTTNAASPTPFFNFLSGGTIDGLAASGSAAFMVESVSGSRALEMFAVGGGIATLQGTAPLPNDGTGFRRVRAFGGTVAAVVSATDCNLFTFAAPNAAGLTARGVISIAGANLQDAAVSGTTLYLLDSTGFVRVYDIANPNAPLPIVSRACTAGRTGMAVSGDWLGVVGDALDFFNISNRASPLAVASASLPAPSSSVAAQSGPSGPHFAVAAGSCGVRVFAAPTVWAPVVTDQPDNTSTCPGGSAMFTVAALSPPASGASYQWSRNGVGGGPIAGATGPTLTISPVTAADTLFTYSCTLTNLCGSVTSAAASLALCRVDVNCSGTVSVQDIFDYLTLYFAENPAADFNGVAGLTVQDLFDFLAAYFAGCA